MKVLEHKNRVGLGVDYWGGGGLLEDPEWSQKSRLLDRLNNHEDHVELCPVSHAELAARNINAEVK